MPLLTRDLPPGGRHIDRAVPPAVPLAPAAARVRQLLPVGLLVAASSAGVALSPMLGGGTSAVADPHHDASSFRFPGTVPSADHTAGSSAHLDRAAYVVSRDADRPAGKHRAAVADEEPSVAPTVAGAETGGKHRASGTAVETAPVTQQVAPKHSTATPAQASATPTADAEPTATVSSSASATPTSTATTTPTQPSDVLTTTVGGVGQVVGGVLGTVGSLLGGN